MNGGLSVLTTLNSAMWNMVYRLQDILLLLTNQLILLFFSLFPFPHFLAFLFRMYFSDHSDSFCQRTLHIASLEQATCIDHFYTDGRTPWTGDQLIARPLPKHRTTQTQNKRDAKLNMNELQLMKSVCPKEGSSYSTFLLLVGWN
jgi:hypothetical protein